MSVSPDAFFDKTPIFDYAKIKSMAKKASGKIMWADLTTKHAEQLCDFYKQVAGWEDEELAMRDENGEYADYVMSTEENQTVAGICHARGVNANVPPQWIMYIAVEDIEKSMENCEKMGGKIIHKSLKKDGTYNYVLVQDPTGAVFGIGTN